MASLTAPSRESKSKQVSPACAQTWAIPRPMVPVPITATTRSDFDKSATALFSLELRLSLFHEGAHPFFLIASGKLQLECLALQHKRGIQRRIQSGVYDFLYLHHGDRRQGGNFARDLKSPR